MEPFGSDAIKSNTYEDETHQAHVITNSAQPTLTPSSSSPRTFIHVVSVDVHTMPWVTASQSELRRAGSQNVKRDDAVRQCTCVAQKKSPARSGHRKTQTDSSSSSHESSKRSGEAAGTRQQQHAWRHALQTLIPLVRCSMECENHPASQQ